MLTIWRTNTRRHSVHAAVYWNDEPPNLRPTPKSAPRNTVETAARPARSKINER
jgi:hypothetical protein